MKERLIHISVNACRLLLAVTFILSGFVKAVDPMGTAYKIGEYLQAMHIGAAVPQAATVAMSVALSALEFSIGIFLLFAIRRRLASRAAVVLLAVMTPLTLWLAVANPVSDCGCFGDAVVLTNWQTLWKNVVLLAAAIVVALRPEAMFRFVSETNQWIVINYTVLFILTIAGWSLYDLPLFDFRPYHVGANIPAGMAVPEGEELPQLQTTFILEKDGEQREFTLDDYPDSTWTFVDSRTVQTSEGYVPPIHDFSLTTDEGDDITDEVLSDTSYVLLLVSPHLEQADDSRLDLLNELYEYCQQQGYAFYGLTASGSKAIGRWRDLTGADYPFCTVDETTLKTIIRSNPGLVLLKGGTVMGKWSCNNLPQLSDAEAALPLERLPMGQMPRDAVGPKIVKLLLWFVLPLVLLTIADRLWMWTKWLRRKPKKQEKQEEEGTTV
ncbi:MAG: DoxX family protein [Prevotella sp.]|nr:DoxX family protein [Prevotella sp.]